MQNSPVITIDGPSGVGKGTMATMLANKLCWHFLDSGAIYRLLALKISLVGATGGRPVEWADMARNLDIYFKDGRTYLDNQDVTDDIRREEVGLMASKTSAFPEVRQALLERQRAFAQAPGLVTDGRDMGSVVFPNAFIKFYLDADAEIRARRREQQLKARGISVKFGDLLEDIEKRDRQDKSRSVAPLVIPEGAIVIDTGLLNKEQVFEKMLDEVRSCLESNGGAIDNFV
ncbi:MAG: (d)CMP kinase [Pseudomonadota bacterium]